MAKIERFRGDTAADRFTVKDQAGAVVNITGYSFKLTVNRLKHPPDAVQQLFQVVGTIISGSSGIVEFVPNGTQANQLPGRYFYDVEMVDAAARVTTLEKDEYVFKQDVTK